MVPLRKPGIRKESGFCVSLLQPIHAPKLSFCPDRFFRMVKLKELRPVLWEGAACGRATSSRYNCISGGHPFRMKWLGT